MNTKTAIAIKTVLVTGGGFLAPLLLSFVDHPSGGLATALQHNATYAIAWGGFSYTLHNLFDHLYGAPGTVTPPVVTK